MRASVVIPQGNPAAVAGSARGKCGGQSDPCDEFAACRDTARSHFLQKVGDLSVAYDPRRGPRRSTGRAALAPPSPTG